MIGISPSRSTRVPPKLLIDCSQTPLRRIRGESKERGDVTRPVKTLNRLFATFLRVPVRPSESYKEVRYEAHDGLLIYT